LQLHMHMPPHFPNCCCREGPWSALAAAATHCKQTFLACLHGSWAPPLPQPCPPIPASLRPPQEQGKKQHYDQLCRPPPALDKGLLSSLTAPPCTHTPLLRPGGALSQLAHFAPTYPSFPCSLTPGGRGRGADPAQTRGALSTS
jgi:hypothetical protein